MKQKYQMKKPEKLNLVPILDSVFIFIFFLLMSAQFVDVHEIGSSLPMEKEMTDTNEPKDPLNLIVEVSKDDVVVKTGVKVVQTRTFASTQKEELRTYLIDLKQKNQKENTIIIKSHPKVPFQRLVAVIDNTQAAPESKEKLFEQIVFDNKMVTE